MSSSVIESQNFFARVKIRLLISDTFEPFFAFKKAEILSIIIFIPGVI